MASIVAWRRASSLLCVFSYFRFKVGFCHGYKQRGSKLALHLHFSFFPPLLSCFLTVSPLRHQKAVALLTGLLFSAGGNHHWNSRRPGVFALFALQNTDMNCCFWGLMRKCARWSIQGTETRNKNQHCSFLWFDLSVCFLPHMIAPWNPFAIWLNI